MEFGNPPKGESAKLEAYEKHVARARCKPLDRDTLNTAVERASSQRGKLTLTSVPFDDDLSFSTLQWLVELACCTVGGDKTPGYPLNLEFGNNQMAFDSVGEEIKLAAVARLHILLDQSSPFEEFVQHPLGLVLSGMVDPSSVFIKNEPHPPRKLREKRYRCINPVSLVDHLVESVLFSEPAEVLKRDLYVNGSAVGIGFSDDQMSEFVDFVRSMNNISGNPCSEDVSGFDALHTPQVMLASAALDQAVYTSKRGLSSWNLANRRWCISVTRSLATIGGKLYSKVQPGAFNSGSKDTSRRNTILRTIYAYYIGLLSGNNLKFVLANGDDALTWGVDDVKSYVESAQTLNIKLRDVTQNHKFFEFCSHRYHYETGRGELLSWPKSIYRMLTNTTLTYADAKQAQQEARHNEQYENIGRFIESLSLS